MRVLVVGATGVLGRATLPALKAVGHQVFGLARTPEKLLLVDTLGANPVRGDLLDAARIRQIVQETQPEIIVNLATAIPLQLRLTPNDWEQNNRVRLEGSANLLAAAEQIPLQLLIQESVGYVCAPQNDAWLDEDSPYTTTPFIQPTIQMERQVRAGRVPFTLFRFGALQSAEAWHTQQTFAALQRGLLPILGKGENFTSPIHAEDAAQAIVRAVANPAAVLGQTFCVVDDAPTEIGTIQSHLAETLGRGKPRHIPPTMAQMFLGSLTVEMLTASYRLRNTRLKQALGFAPRYPTYREAWAQMIPLLQKRDITLSLKIGG